MAPVRNLPRRTLNTHSRLPTRRSTTARDASIRSSALRRTLTTPTYTAADRALASSVRSKLASGLLDNQPTEKERVMTLLATLESADSNNLARVPDRRVLDRARTELVRFNTTRTPTTGTSTGSSPGTTTGTTGTTTTTGTTPNTTVEGDTAVAATDDARSVGIKNIKFSWDYPASAQSNITGFRLYYENQLVAQLDDAGGRAFDVDLELHEGSNAFYMTAMNASDPNNVRESVPSNTVYSVQNPSE